MATGYVLYNKLAGTKAASENYQLMNFFVQDNLKYIDVLQIKDYKVFISGLEKDDYIILCGGDGTLNRFINNMENIPYEGEILYFPNGTGNDFAFDVGNKAEPFSITKYIRDLPLVVVKGKKYRFLNGVGFGIDGYCCEVGDELKKKSNKPVNYTSIAIKGLLFHYKPTKAKVTVDGITHYYKKVWIAPTMNGRYYGGGMMPTPNQSRNNKDTLSTMIFHDSGKLKTLMIFPSIFKGKHIKYTKNITVLTGHTITVEFNEPRALQIDGETILGVTSYTAYAPNSVDKSN